MIITIEDTGLGPKMHNKILIITFYK